MATRANIKLVGDGKAVWIYKHWDGYPSEVIDQLEAYLTRAKNKIADEVSLCDNMCIIKQAILNDSNYELTNGQHGDIEYLYKINVNTFKIRTSKIKQPWD